MAGIFITLVPLTRFWRISGKGVFYSFTILGKMSFNIYREVFLSFCNTLVFLKIFHKNRILNAVGAGFKPTPIKTTLFIIEGLKKLKCYLSLIFFRRRRREMKLKGRKLLWLLSVLVVPVTYGGYVMGGEMEPADLPGHATKATTDAWYQKITKATKRFKIVLDGAAVLDKETGLVWEKSPDTTARTWADAISYAYSKNVGGRKGWRLPTVEELASLVDPTRSNPALPVGHPFTNVQSASYWSSTTYVNGTSYAWGVHFNVGVVSYGDETNNYYVWCVRGGHGHDGM
ncbi:MAG: hypothetical protein B6D34_08995 [Candidatus Brocadia sp. UTAMX1]|nr:MAG: hypothetical protein B6D34_08995 [Candidatus Brocadia sp. UTAMX1]